MLQNYASKLRFGLHHHCGPIIPLLHGHILLWETDQAVNFVTPGVVNLRLWDDL